LQAVSSWLNDNKLSLHLGKTESIVFGSKHKLKSNPSLNVSCNGIAIQSTSSVKDIGATLDQNLSCENMASIVINKANAWLKFPYRKRHFLTEHTKNLLVSFLTPCHFDYTCSFWYNGLTTHWKSKLQVTHNKLVRFVLNLDHRAYIDHNHIEQLN